MRQSFPTRRLRYLADVNPPVPSHLRLGPEAEYQLLPMEAIKEFSVPDNGHKRPVQELLSGYSYIEPTDVAYAKVTPCFENGKGLVGADLDEPVFATTEVTVLRPRDEADQRFLSYVIQSTGFRDPAISSMTGAGGLKRVSESYIKDLHLPAPSIFEQQQVADYLDHETAEIDKFSRDLELLGNLFKERFDARLRRIFSPDQDLKKVPLHRVARLVTGKTPSASTRELPSITTGIPWMKPGDIRPETRMSEASGFVEDPASDGIPVIRGASPFVVCIGATIGKIGYSESPFCTNQQITSTVPVAVDPVYLYFSLRASQKWIISNSNQSTLPIINSTILGNLPLLYPTSNTQRQIAGDLDISLRDLTSSLNTIENAIDLVRERRAALITAAVTGQIDVTARNRPAVEQLEDDVAQGLHREYA